LRFGALADFLTGRAKEGYRFSHPIPKFELSEAVISLLIDLDNEYYMQRYGKPHPNYEYRDMEDRILWAIIDDKLLPEVSTSYPDTKFTTPKLFNAYYAARTARFEHGETPNPE